VKKIPRTIPNEEVFEKVLRKIKHSNPNEPNLSLYAPYYIEACNEFAVPISVS